MIYVLKHIFSRASNQNINWILIHIFIFKCPFNLKRKKLCFPIAIKQERNLFNVCGLIVTKIVTYQKITVELDVEKSYIAC